MNTTTDFASTQTAIRVDLGAIFVSLELSKSTWLVTSLSPGSQKMSCHLVKGGDMPALLNCLENLRRKAKDREGQLFPMIVIQEAGLDGFWIHRILEAQDWITSYVVDAASIAMPRRRRRVKTDRIDGAMLVRTLMAWVRREPRVCSMVRVPSVEDEDRRRINREREKLVHERTRHISRIKALLLTIGVRDYNPARRDRHKRLEQLCAGDGQPLPPHLKAQISRELDRLDLVDKHIKAVEAERDVLCADTSDAASPMAKLIKIRGIGPEFANAFACEGFFRHFDNRRQVAAYAGLAPTPWRSGAINLEQGVSKAGNPRLRSKMIQAAWLWLRHQPDSELARWFHEQARHSGRAKKVAIVALARKLLVALWKYVTSGVVIEGAIMTKA